VNAVQTLSRLNRVHPDKQETMVLDFANEAEEIRKGFEPYYDRTLLSEGTDPNLLYDLQTRLADFHFYGSDDVERLAALYFDPKGTADKLHAALQRAIDRYRAASEDERHGFRGHLTDYVRLYAFLSQVITFTDPDLEKLYVYGRLLLRKLPVSREELPREILQAIDVDSYRVQKTGSGKITLERGSSELDPMRAKGTYTPSPDEIEALSEILRALNQRFGTDFTEEDKVFIEQLEAKLASDPALEASVRVNPRENARLTFDQVANDRIQEMIDSNFKFYKQIADDREFARFFLGWLFDRYYRRTAPKASE
jgi:type I restriction enzyme R subunit